MTCKIISRSFCMWNRKLLTGVKQIPARFKSSVPRLSWLGCRCAHATASTKRMCQTPGRWNDEIFRHSWPWSEAPAWPQKCPCRPISRNSKLQLLVWNCCAGHIGFEMRFWDDEDCRMRFVILSVPLTLQLCLWVQGLHWWHWKQQVLKGGGWKINQRRARNLYQITQMTFFTAICRTPWNMVDPSSAPQ